MWWLRENNKNKEVVEIPKNGIETPTPVEILKEQTKMDNQLASEIDWVEARFLGEEKEKTRFPQIKENMDWENKAKKVEDLLKIKNPVTVLDNSSLLMIKDQDTGNNFYFNKKNNFLQIQKQNVDLDTIKSKYQEQVAKSKFKEMADFFWNNQEVEINKIEVIKKSIVDKNLKTYLTEMAEIRGYRKINGLPVLGSWGGTSINVVVLNDGTVFRIQIENPFTEMVLTGEEVPLAPWFTIKEKKSTDFLVFSVDGKDEEKNMALSQESFENIRAKKIKLVYLYYPSQKKYIPYYLIEALANSDLSDNVELGLGLPALPTNLYN